LLRLSNEQIDRLIEIHPHLKQRIEGQLEELGELLSEQRAQAMGDLTSYLDRNFQTEWAFWRRLCNRQERKLNLLRSTAANMPDLTVRRAWNAAAWELGDPSMDNNP
jgi:hypothetical protein